MNDAFLMKKYVVHCLVAILWCVSLSDLLAQDTISYVVSFPNAVHHEAAISITVPHSSATVHAVMSKSSPGRYAEHNFAKNVYNVNAIDQDGKAIRIEKISPDEWEMHADGAPLKLSYTLYGNHADGTYSGIDADFANINMPASVMWIKGMDNLPIKVTFQLPDTGLWQVATQLMLLDSARHTYFAPNLQYLMDSPCILGAFDVMDLAGEFDGYHIKMAINSKASEEDMHAYGKMAAKIVSEEKAVYGSFPAFMDSTYIFLCSYGPGFFGDGMEHRNSTMVSSRAGLSGNAAKLIGTISHEFFHCWNIERIRPASLEPFDFTRANMNGELWFGEGFTNYYGDLILCRSGLISEKKYLGILSRNINRFVNTPGVKFGSPVYMSKMAPFSDQAAAMDETNFSNTFFSYYYYGEMVALALDLSLRTSYPGLSLDDLMKSMWEKFGRTERPYHNADIQNTLAELTGDKGFAEDFFNRYIYGNEITDYGKLFDKTGYKLIKKNPNKLSLGYVRLSFEGDTATVLSTPLIGSGLYEAGVNKNDLILSLDGQKVTSYPELNFIVGTRKVGDEISIEYAHHGDKKTGTMVLKEDSQLVLIPKDRFSIKVSESEIQTRKEWLDTRQ